MWRTIVEKDVEESQRGSGELEDASAALSAWGVKLLLTPWARASGTTSGKAQPLNIYRSFSGSSQRWHPSATSLRHTPADTLWDERTRGTDACRSVGVVPSVGPAHLDLTGNLYFEAAGAVRWHWGSRCAKIVPGAASGAARSQRQWQSAKLSPWKGGFERRGVFKTVVFFCSRQLALLLAAFSLPSV